MLMVSLLGVGADDWRKCGNKKHDRMKKREINVERECKDELVNMLCSPKALAVYFAKYACI